MTIRLYYPNSKLRTFKAFVLAQKETENGPAVTLDQTGFYPTSGGQPHDTGVLNQQIVRDVWVGDDNQVWHLLDAPLKSNTVTGEIEWSRRFDHMQHHTGQHMLSAAFLKLCAAQTLSFHLGAETCSIDVDQADLEWETLLKIENEVNEVIWENRAVTIHFASPEQLENYAFRKRPNINGEIRIIQIEDFDTSACGGTHVEQTGEVGQLKITGMVTYKGGSRLSFLCGKRALADYQRVLQGLSEAGRLLSVHQDEVEDAIIRRQLENRELRSALHGVSDQLRQREADDLWANTQPIDGIRWITMGWPNRQFSEIQRIAHFLRDKSETVALLAGSDGTQTRLICTRSADLPAINANSILQKALTSLQGRGGGKPDLAQGGAPYHEQEQVTKAIQEAIKT